jgi:hypothetical protein
MERSRRLAVGIFLACWTVYHVNGRPQPEVDCVAATYSAWSLVRGHGLDISLYPALDNYRGGEIRPAANGTWVSYRPPGSALAAIPFVAPLALFCERPPSATVMLHLGKLTAASFAAATVVVFFFLCCRLAPLAAWPATVLLALGTSLWSVASQALWMHAPATFWICFAMYLLTTDSEERGWRGALGAGVALGLAVLTRPSTAIFAAATGGCCLWQRRWRDSAGLILGGAVPLALLCLHGIWYFGDAVAGGYAHDPWDRATPLWLGVSGLLVAPSRGLLVYSPALLLALPGVIVLFRSDSDIPAAPRGMIAAWVLAAVVTVGFYGRWCDWKGGWCYGPRFLCELLPLFCLLFALGFARLRYVWQQRAALGLLALSIAVHFVGVVGHKAHADWYNRHGADDQGRCLFALRDTQIEAHARAVLQSVGVLPRQ